jgi:hypothetical protein
LLIRTPHARLGGKSPAPPGQISGRRIAVSLLGLFLGIFASFYISGVRPAEKVAPSEGVAATAGEASDRPVTVVEPEITGEISWARFRVVGFITLVIVGLTYQGLFLALRLYQNEPTLLVLFISFQYGYFWESVVEGVSNVVG